jgi:hypothetical protein
MRDGSNVREGCGRRADQAAWLNVATPSRRQMRASANVASAPSQAA